MAPDGCPAEIDRVPLGAGLVVGALFALGVHSRAESEAPNMPKTTAPLLSFDARGQIAKSMVYSSWRGRPYVRRYVTPSNPQSAEQTITRNAFSFLQAIYKLAPPIAVAPWDAYIKGKPLTGRNAFTKFNLPVLRGEADLANMVFSPGALGGLPPVSVVATPGADLITVTCAAPSPVPSGWTVTAAQAACIADQDPDTGVLTTVVANQDLTDPYSFTLTNLDEVLHYVGVWLKWLRSDGLVAYSPSVLVSATPT